MCGGRCLDFMNRRDPGSRELTGVIQVKFQELWENNSGAVLKHASL